MKKHLLLFLGGLLVAFALRTALIAITLVAGYAALHAAVWAFGQPAGLPYGLGVCTGATIVGFWLLLWAQRQLEAASDQVALHALLRFME